MNASVRTISFSASAIASTNCSCSRWSIAPPGSFTRYAFGVGGQEPLAPTVNLYKAVRTAFPLTPDSTRPASSIGLSCRVCRRRFARRAVPFRSGLHRAQSAVLGHTACLTKRLNDGDPVLQRVRDNLLLEV